MNTTEKIIGILVFFILAAWATELLNYKDWLLFGLGVLSEIICVTIIFKLLKSFFKTKNKTT